MQTFHRPGGAVTYYVSPNAGASGELPLGSSPTPGLNGSDVRRRLMITQK
jgi:hypothetical protein